jgi:hypothetical protein
MKKILGLVSVVFMTATAFAQENNGSVCIQTFEDRNGNATLDAGEPFIVKDVGVNLANAEGIITQTAMLDDSPRASSGLVCFSALPEGQYTLQVVSAAYNSTTNTAFTAIVTDSSIPQRFDYGGQVITPQIPDSLNTANAVDSNRVRSRLESAFFAGIGSALVIAVLSIVGAFFYFLLFRPRLQKAFNDYRQSLPPRNMRSTDTGMMYAVRPDTGSMPAVRPDTGSMPPLRPETGTNKQPIELYKRPDTDSMPPVRLDEPVRDESDTDRYKPPKD